PRSRFSPHAERTRSPGTGPVARGRPAKPPSQLRSWHSRRRGSRPCRHRTAVEQRPRRGRGKPAQDDQAPDVRKSRLRPASPSRALRRVKKERLTNPHCARGPITTYAGEPISIAANMRARRGAAEWLHEGPGTRRIEVRPATPAANGRPLPIANQPAGTRARRIPPSSRPAEPRTVRRRPRAARTDRLSPGPGNGSSGLSAGTRALQSSPHGHSLET